MQKEIELTNAIAFFLQDSGNVDIRIPGMDGQR